jgi:hypothetical protein
MRNRIGLRSFLHRSSLTDITLGGRVGIFTPPSLAAHLAQAARPLASKLRFQAAD